MAPEYLRVTLLRCTARRLALVNVVCGGLGLAQEPAAVARLGLGEAVRLALQSNFALLDAQDDLAGARARVSVARADFYPKLTPSFVRGDEGHWQFALSGSQRVPWSGATLSSSTFSGSAGAPGASSVFELTQPLLRGFGPNASLYALRNSRRARQGRERALHLLRQRTALQVAAAFYEVWHQRTLREVARQSGERSVRLRRASEARLEVGLASKLDVLRAQLQEASARDSALRAEASLADAIERFRLLLGRAPTDPFEPQDGELPDVEDGPAAPLDDLLARAQSQRQDLAEARDQLQDSRRTLALSRQNLLPQIDLRVGYSDQSLSGLAGASPDLRTRRFSLALVSSYPLERSSERVESQLNGLEVAARQRALRQRGIEIEGEVRRAERDLEQIRASVRLQQEAVDIAEQQQRLASLRYERGVASNFDVVDAENGLVQAKSALAGLLARYQVVRLELKRATGELDPDHEFGP